MFTGNRSALKFLSGALLVAGPVLFAVRVPAQSPAQLQKTFQADYDSQDAAFGRNDPVGATAYFASDFMLIDKATGQLTKNDLPRQRMLVTQIHQLAPKSVVAHSYIRHLTLNAQKNQAVVFLQTRYVALAMNPRSHKPMTIVISGYYQELWAKRPMGWRITAQQKISTKTTVT